MARKKPTKLPLIVVVVNDIVKELWWRRTHLRSIKPGTKVLTHKSQKKVPKTHIRIRYGSEKEKVAVLPNRFFKQINGKEIK